VISFAPLLLTRLCVNPNFHAKLQSNQGAKVIHHSPLTSPQKEKAIPGQERPFIGTLL